jgi:hypothetical protein
MTMEFVVCHVELCEIRHGRGEVGDVTGECIVLKPQSEEAS